MFARLAAAREGAFVPFLMLGDPAPEHFLEVVRALVEAGADALELGIPFSDPVADGSVIQAASVRALARGMTPARSWELIATCRSTWPELPIGVLVYANLVLHDAPERFYRSAHAAGVDSVLVADLPLAESTPTCRTAEEYGIAPVLIAPPNATEETLARIAERGGGYTYVVAREGVTGKGLVPARDATTLIARLHRLGAPPPLVGFGVRGPEAIRRALAMGAAGAIVGSAIIERLSPANEDLAANIADVGRYANRLKAATHS
jgi:tryptophan synthase alpha chain